MGMSLQTWGDREQQNLGADLFCIFVLWTLNWTSAPDLIWMKYHIWGWSLSLKPFLCLFDSLGFTLLFCCEWPRALISGWAPAGSTNLCFGVTHTEGLWGLKRQEVSSSVAKSEGKRGNFRIHCLPLHDGKLEIHTGISPGKKMHLWELGCCISVSNFIYNPFYFYKESEQFKLTYPLI